jgi:O-Antigen ligase
MTRLQELRTRLRTEGLPLLPAAVVVTVVIAWVTSGGGYESQPALDAGYEPDPWYLGALALVVLACATAFGVGRVRLSRPAKVACAALGGYVAWSFLSILWAHDQGAAFLGSDRALVYLAAFVTFAILPWGDWSARVALATLIAGVGAVAIVTAIRLAVLSDPGGLYLEARLAYPLGYYNADAVLFMGTAVSAIALASRRHGPGLLRVAGLVVAALCLQLDVLSQSRGWLFSASIVLALMLALVPDRLRLLAFTLGPAAAAAAVTPALLRVYGRATPHGAPLTQPRLSAVLHEQGNHAVRAMLVADVALAALATLLVAADRRLRVHQTARRRLNRSAAALALAAALAGVVVGLVAVHGDPIGRAERAWRSFADAPENATDGYSRFTTLASHRADIWRVAIDEFARHPLDGIGQDNFAASYTRLRHSDEQPRWTHSIELRLLTHTGLVGALLFALFLLSALLAALRGRRGTRTRATAGILLLPLIVWLVQGSIDWFWEYPALSVPALAFTAAAGALGHVVPAPPSPHRRWHPMRIAAALCAALLGAAAIAALAVPFVAARKARKGTLVWPAHPALAYAELRSATDLMPFDAQLYLVGAAIALNLGERGRAHTWLERAERRDDQNWLTPFALGLIEGEQGRRGRSRAQLRRALSLNPREQTIAIALERLRGRRPLTFAEAQLLLAPRIVTPGA